MSMFRVDQKSTNWYRRIFFWIINVSVVNGWLLYRRHSSQRLVPAKEQLDLIEFTAVVSQSPIFRNKLHSYFSRKRGRQSVHNVHTDKGPREKSNCPKKKSATLHTSDETRYDTVGHYPIDFFTCANYSDIFTTNMAEELVSKLLKSSLLKKIS